MGINSDTMFRVREILISLTELSGKNPVLDLNELFRILPDVTSGGDIIEVLLKFQESKDQFFEVYRTNCGSEFCSHVSRSHYFTLVGNESRKYCLMQISLFEEREAQIRFCENINPVHGIELNQYIEPFRDKNELPF